MLPVVVKGSVRFRPTGFGNSATEKKKGRKKNEKDEKRKNGIPQFCSETLECDSV